MGPCKHPGHADHDRWFFTTALLPIMIMGKQIANMFDVCYICYNEYDIENPKGPRGTMTPNHFKDQRRHRRYCFNNRCDPRGKEIPEKLQ